MAEVHETGRAAAAVEGEGGHARSDQEARLSAREVAVDKLVALGWNRSEAIELLWPVVAEAYFEMGDSAMDEAYGNQDKIKALHDFAADCYCAADHFQGPYPLPPLRPTPPTPQCAHCGEVIDDPGPGPTWFGPPPTPEQDRDSVPRYHFLRDPCRAAGGMPPMAGKTPPLVP